MKKRFLVLLMVMCLILCGCGKAKPVSKEVEKKMIGSYELTDIKGSKKKYTQEEMDYAKENYRIYIREKGEAILYKDGKDHFVEYNNKYILSTNKKKEPEQTKYKFKDGKIIIYYNKNVYTFTRVKDPMEEAKKAAKKAEKTTTTKIATKVTIKKKSL